LCNHKISRSTGGDLFQLDTRIIAIRQLGVVFVRGGRPEAVPQVLVDGVGEFG
jgi:hypothetical protein